MELILKELKQFVLFLKEKEVQSKRMFKVVYYDIESFEMWPY